MPTTQSLPRARVEGLITTETASDLLIYDVERNELHTLNSVAATVWRAADGSRTVMDLALDLALDSRVVEEALGKLSSAELLTGYSPVQQSFRSTSRRRMLKTAVAGAVIVSVSAPMAAAAQTGPLVCGVSPGYVNGTPGCIIAQAEVPCCNDDVFTGVCFQNPQGDWRCSV
jgi:hypothetical protein